MLHQNKHIKEEKHPEYLQECINTWCSLSGRFQNIPQLTLLDTFALPFTTSYSSIRSLFLFLSASFSFMIIEVKSSDDTIQPTSDAFLFKYLYSVDLVFPTLPSNSFHCRIFLWNCSRENSPLRDSYTLSFTRIDQITYQKHSQNPLLNVVSRWSKKGVVKVGEIFTRFSFYYRLNITVLIRKAALTDTLNFHLTAMSIYSTCAPEILYTFCSLQQAMKNICLFSLCNCDSAEFLLRL